jgi:two-component sensor histidine kinase
MMADVVRQALAPHCADGDRAVISGPDIALDGRRAHALTLALHELATNAAKHGALAVDGGWIEVMWTRVSDQLEFIWREHDGPVVTAPTRQGFGTMLITRNMAVAFGGKVDLGFLTGGVECRLTSPIPLEASPADRAPPKTFLLAR